MPTSLPGCWALVHLMQAVLLSDSGHRQIIFWLVVCTCRLRAASPSMEAAAGSASLRPPHSTTPSATGGSGASEQVGLHLYLYREHRSQLKAGHEHMHSSPPVPGSVSEFLSLQQKLYV
jgi:hypothetical protein